MSTTASTAQAAHGRDVPFVGDNKLMKALLIAAITASGLSMIFSIGTAFVSAQDSGSSVASAEHSPD